MGLDNYPEMKPCEHVLNYSINIKKEIEEIPYEPTEISRKFAHNIINLKTGLEDKNEIEQYLQENGLPEFKLLIQKIPDLDMILFTIDNDYVFCNLSICPFKMIYHTYGIFGTPCWLRGSVYNELIYKLTGLDIYKELDPDNIEYISNTLNEIMNQEEILNSGRKLKDYYSIDTFYYVIFDKSLQELSEDFIIYVSEVLKEIEKIYIDTYSKIRNFMFSNYYISRMKQLLLEIIKTGQSEFPKNILEQTKSFEEELRQELNELFNEICEEVSSKQEPYNKLCDTDIFNNMIKIVEMNLYFGTYVLLKYDKKIYPWG